MIDKIQEGLDLIIEELRKTTTYTGHDQTLTITTFTNTDNIFISLYHDTTLSPIKTAEDLLNRLEHKRDKHKDCLLYTSDAADE